SGVKSAPLSSLAKKPTAFYRESISRVARLKVMSIFFLAESFLFVWMVPIWNKRFRHDLALVLPATSFQYGGARIGSKESKSPISLSFTATPLNDSIGTAAVR